MDNLGSHKGSCVRRAIRAAGAKFFYLQPYSPDLNPSSRPSPSSKLSCTKPTLDPLTTLGNASDRSSTASPPSECAAYFRNARSASI